MAINSYFKQPPRWQGRRFHARPTLGRVRLGGRPANAWNYRQGRRPKKFFSWAGALKYLLITIACLLLLGGAVVVWYSRDLPDPNRLIDRSIAQTTKLYDRTGQTVLYEIHGAEQRSMVTLDKIPKIVQQATIVAEDKSFYSHGGISLRGIIRAAVVNILTGQRGQGGSTLTQQLVKNAILSKERLFSRKLREIILAWRIEQTFSKDQILQMYLNEIPYGGSTYGIQAAAQSYFNKNVESLDLGEAAALAALPKAPSALSPYTASGLEKLIIRQQYILDSLVGGGYITGEEARAAKEKKLGFVPRREVIKAPHFSMWVYIQLVEKYGQRLVEEGGLKVITSLNTNLQQAAEESIDQQIKKNRDRFQANNAALVSIDVPTGQVVAMVGSANFFEEEIDGQVNVALAPRQPGSSFKPIVYAAAFDLGYSPQTMVFDLETDFPTDQGKYHPKNYDLKERGPVSLKQALAGSLNIPAVKVLYLTGIDRVLNLAQQLGYTTLADRSRLGLSLVLGGGEVSLLEHTGAYATLARGGKGLPFSSILKIEAGDGRVLEEWQAPSDQQIIKPEVTKTLTGVLSDNNARAFIFGSSNYLTLPDRPVAAKTGTTNNYHDAWTLGYTPQLATGVWVGNSDYTAMKRGADGSVVAAPIWQNFMARAHQGLPVVAFDPPPPAFNLNSKPMLNGSWDGGITVALDKRSGLPANTNTPLEFIEEWSYRQVHEILYWVDKNNPLGATPTNPEQDPAYLLWEEPVVKWMSQQGLVNESPPNTNTQSPSKPFDISVSNPQSGQVITDNNLYIEASAEATGVEWRFSLNGRQVGSSNDGRFTLLLPVNLVDGRHVVTVSGVAGGASVAVNRIFTLRRNGAVQAQVEAVDFISNNSPVMLTLKNINVPLKQVDVYVGPPIGNIRWLGLGNNTNGSWSLVWPGSSLSGEYVFSFSLLDGNDNQWSGGATLITVL